MSNGPVFEFLRDLSIFKRYEVHPEFETLIWANGVVFAPEFLHDNLRVTARLLRTRASDAMLRTVELLDADRGTIVPASAQAGR